MSRMLAKALLDLRVRLDSEGAAQVVWSLWRMGLTLRKAIARRRLTAPICQKDVAVYTRPLP